jgi:hypothetical protein
MTQNRTLIENINNKGKSAREYLTITQEGTYVIRIIQNLSDENEAPFEEYILHRIMHPFYKQMASVRCIGHNCPLCDNAKKQFQIDRASAWQYKANGYYIYNIIDRSKSGSGKLKILKGSWAAHNAIKAKLVEAAMDGVNLGHFTKGRDIEIEVRKVGDKLNYKVYILSEAESKPIAPRILEEIKMVKPIEQIYRLHTREELVDILAGRVPALPQPAKKKFSKSNLIDNLNKKQPSIIKDDINQSKSSESKPKATTESDGKHSAIMDKLNKLDIFEEE